MASTLHGGGYGDAANCRSGTRLGYVKVVSVVGARPQFVKLAPVATALARAGHEHVIVHTGQHYDVGLSDQFFLDLVIPKPDLNLGVGSASHGAQTGAMLAALDAVLPSYAPDWVLAYGDTNSTVATALAAVKLHLPVAHLEAGLRSFNRRMPEEHNRVLTDHAADLCLAPSDAAVAQLEREGLAARTRHVGDVMADVCYQTVQWLRTHPQPVQLGAPYVVATIHRADNTDDPTRLRALVGALSALPVPVLLSVHPRLAKRCANLGIDLHEGALRPAEPLGYAQMIAAVLGAEAVVTDSGGLQKEAFLLRRRCVTLRTETEWSETVESGWNVLAPGDDPPLASLVSRPLPTSDPGQPYGEGHAADAVVAVLAHESGR
jgi:UDP-N-acetylglucosamine 2-epimerase (non-hydrolysing)